MQSIQDIIDTKTTLGFNWFYGDLINQGYLRRMLQTNPSLKAIYDQLKDDIEFVNDVDKDIFIRKGQLKAFKTLKKYLKEAKDYITDQLNKTKEKRKSEEIEREAEIKSLQRDLRNDLIDQEDFDYAVKMLFKPSSDDLSEVKSKFEQIDHKVKQELKKYGYEEEDLEFDEEDEGDEGEYILPNEEKTPDINKLIDEDNRRYSMTEFNDLYEDMEKVKEEKVNEENINNKQKDIQNQKQSLAISTIVKGREQERKTGTTPQQRSAKQKANAQKLAQQGVDPKLILQLQADDKI